MTDPDDHVERFLAGLDHPALRDAPPAPGSPRYNAILEKAMSSQTATPYAAHDYRNGAPPNSRPGRPFRSWKGWATLGTVVAAAAVFVAVAVGVVPGINQPKPAAAAVLSAADRTAKETRFRSETTNRYKTKTAPPEWKTTSGNAEFNGSDFRLVEHTPYGDHVYTGVGKNVYETFQGQTTVKSLAGFNPGSPGDRPIFMDRTFAQASTSLVRASLTDSDVKEVGDEQVRGAATKHFRVGLSPAAVQALAKAAQANSLYEWFGLNDDTSTIQSVDIWLDRDDLIRRIQWTGAEVTGTNEFYDFGASITINAPTVTAGK
jgi:hypothetical protein